VRNVPQRLAQFEFSIVREGANGRASLRAETRHLEFRSEIYLRLTLSVNAAKLNRAPVYSLKSGRRIRKRYGIPNRRVTRLIFADSESQF